MTVKPKKKRGKCEEKQKENKRFYKGKLRIFIIKNPLDECGCINEQ